MATVPIEIVLQDAGTPVDPTPTPTPESGEETNIVVPSTGTISNDGGNNGGIGSAISIILPIVIIVLALGTMVALLIRRYNKRKMGETGMTRKERRATIVSSTIAVLAITVLLGQLIVSGIVRPIATNAATDDTSSDNSSEEGNLVVDDKITITVTRESGSDEAIVSSIDTKSYATVYKSFGYEVAIAMAGNTTNLYLNGDTSSEYYIAPVSDGTLADNTWGYTLDGEEYTAMPLIDDLAVVAKGTTPVSNEEVDINYGVKLSSDMPAGAYTGEIEYILADTGFPAALRTMQDMTTAICSSVPTPNPFKADNTTIEDNVPTIMLPDSRDNKLYRVAKLADGKCWMTQNLDLQKEDLLDGVVLNDSNTDNPAAGFTLPTSQNGGDENWGDSDSTDIETTHVYDIVQNVETPYRYCLDYRYGYCFEKGDAISEGELGNFYNWYTATASTGTCNTGSGEGNPDEATGSICPKGWRLPNSSNNGSATDYSTLLYQYGVSDSPTSSSYTNTDKTAIYKAPLSLVPTGGYYRGLNGVGNASSLWSSIASSKTSANYSNFTSDSANLWAPSGKVWGYAVRCLAR